jgi:hypothetical protein
MGTFSWVNRKGKTARTWLARSRAPFSSGPMMDGASTCTPVTVVYEPVPPPYATQLILIPPLDAVVRALMAVLYARHSLGLLFSAKLLIIRRGAVTFSEFMAFFPTTC